MDKIRYYGIKSNGTYSYWTYDHECVFSSARYDHNRDHHQSYADEYEWYTEVCEEYDVEPEQYED